MVKCGWRGSKGLVMEGRVLSGFLGFSLWIMGSYYSVLRRKEPDFLVIYGDYSKGCVCVCVCLWVG